MRLERQNHDVVRAERGEVVRCEEIVGHQFSAVGLHESQAVVTDRGEVLTAGQHTHRHARRCQTHRHQTADRSGAHNAHPHRASLPPVDAVQRRQND